MNIHIFATANIYIHTKDLYSYICICIGIYLYIYIYIYKQIFSL